MKLVPKVPKTPRPSGPPKSRRQLTVDADVAEAVRAVAEHDDVSNSEAIRRAIKALVQSRPGEWELEEDRTS